MGLRKEIKAVLADVTRDPRAALHAIDILVHAKIEGAKAAKPVFRVDVSDTDDGKIKVALDHNAKKLRADHVVAAAFALTTFGEARVADGCKCADHCGGPAK